MLNKYLLLNLKWLIISSLVINFLLLVCELVIVGINAILEIKEQILSSVPSEKR